MFGRNSTSSVQYILLLSLCISILNLAFALIERLKQENDLDLSSLLEDSEILSSFESAHVDNEASPLYAYVAYFRYAYGEPSAHFSNSHPFAERSYGPSVHFPGS